MRTNTIIFIFILIALFTFAKTKKIGISQIPTIPSLINGIDVYPITNGVPEHGEVQPTIYDYYNFEVTKIFYNQQLEIRLDSEGQAYIYVAFDYPANRTYFFWYSQSTSATQTIIIPRTDPKFKVGTIYVSILGVARAIYTLTVTSGTTSSIVNGNTYSGSAVMGIYNYYYIDIDAFFVQQDCLVSVNAITGDPDVYAAFKTLRPSKEINTWKAETSGSVTFTISSSDPNYQIGRLFIGIYGYSNTTYTVSVTIGKTTELINGLIVDGFVNYNEFTYYYFKMEHYMNNQIILVLCDSSTGFGQVSIFGSSSNTRPSTNGYDWFSTGAPNQFLIYPSESKYPITNLWVAVYGKQRSSFKISIRTPAETRTFYSIFFYSSTL
jgi:hypothetical protein